MSLKTFFANIEADASRFFDKLPAEEQALLTALKPIFTGALGTFVSTMLPVAESLVLGIATSGLPSDEKRTAAVSQLTSAAESAGLTVISGAANLVVEAAYSKLNASGALPAVASAPAPVEPAASTPAAPAAVEAPAPAAVAPSAVG
jgi:hypothetical protein